MSDVKVYELGVYVPGPDSGYIDVVDVEDYKELERQLTSYQIAKDNLELRASIEQHRDFADHGMGCNSPIVYPGTGVLRWTNSVEWKRLALIPMTQ